jgi:hypothetical protein
MRHGDVAMRSYFSVIGAMLIAGILLTACAQQKSADGSAQLCSISGRALDDKGRPVQCWAYAIPVRCINNVIVWDINPLTGLDVKTVRTNESGEYNLRDLPPHEYIVKAGGLSIPPSQSPDCTSCCDKRTEFLDGYYSYSSGSREPKPLLLRAEQHLQGIEIHLIRAELFCVHGEVRDARNALLDKAGISVARKDPGFEWSSSVINQEGKFLLTIPAGTYSIKILEQSGRVLLERQFEVHDKDIERLAITLTDRE